jgi:hypothetical protein
MRFVNVHLAHSHFVLIHIYTYYFSFIYIYIEPNLPFCAFKTCSLVDESLTLREEHRLRVSENRVLRRAFGPERDEVTEGWKKLHNKELHSLYSSTNIN